MTDPFFTLASKGLHSGMTLRWSALVIDVEEERVEPLVAALKALGFTLERVLSDPDNAARFFLHVSEICIHGPASFAVRAADVDRCTAEHNARIGDWSVVRAP